MEALGIFSRYLSGKGRAKPLSMSSVMAGSINFSNLERDL
jgi:hypothetical protein